MAIDAHLRQAQNAWRALILEQEVDSLAYIDAGASVEEKRWRWIRTASDIDLETFSKQINEDFDAFVDNAIEEMRARTEERQC
jgi:hypothetical protein